MSTRPWVDFYILIKSTIDAQHQFACALSEHYYLQNKSVHINMPDATTAKAMDDCLWSHPQASSFIPHHLYETGKPITAPVLVGCDFPEINVAHCVLINLDDKIATTFKRYDRIIEIVRTDPVALTRARKHYRTYQQQGCTLHYTDYGKAQTA